MKVLFVSQQFEHMGKFSGYDNLGTELKINAGINLIFHENRKLNRFTRKLLNMKLTVDYDPDKYGWFHNYRHYLTEYEVVKSSDTINADIIHLAYLENSLGYISDNRDKIKAKVVATSHQPPSWWKMTNKNTKLLQCLDALVVLSMEAKEYFEQFIPGKVFFIPHGIDTQFFSAQRKLTNANEKKKCLFVGNWMRDFNAFVEIVNLVNKTIKNIEIDIVFPQQVDENHPLYALLKQNNINWYRNIDDNSLLTLYKKANVFLLPLLSCTANNALLEASSCEVPIVTNKCGGVTDYLNEQNVYLVNNNSAVQFLEKINFILDHSNADIVKTNAKKQKDFVIENFSWEKVASQMLKLYQYLLV
jgi:glycosyltransferase involved in cell wall biosynthesis